MDLKIAVMNMFKNSKEDVEYIPYLAMKPDKLDSESY